MKQNPSALNTLLVSAPVGNHGQISDRDYCHAGRYVGLLLKFALGVSIFLLACSDHAVADGYVAAAVLRSGCTSAPRPPPPPGQIEVGPDYVIMTVADGNPVTDSIFESLMPLYCSLPANTGIGCVTNWVQWNIVTYDAGGNPITSGCAASGCNSHYCSIVTGYVTAVIRGAAAILPPPPPVGLVAVGSDCVLTTITDMDPFDLEAARQHATEAVFESLMRAYCALPRGTGQGYASGQAQWNVTTFSPAGRLVTSGCALSGCGLHSCVVSNGYISAVLRSECTSAPPPPPPGQIAVGPDYVIMTVADGNPRDYTTAQQLVTDSIFESLMPRYCSLPKNTGVGCVTNRVQWNLVTYDAGGNGVLSGGPTSGPAFHYCSIITGYVSAVIRGASAILPPPPPVGLVAVGSDCVLTTITDMDPFDLEAARQHATEAVFESLMRAYCALPRGTGQGYASGQAQWNVTTFDPAGTLVTSGCALSGCGLHSCVVSNGYITAVLRSECTSAPPPPPPGQIAVGPDYVIMTVADGNPRDYTTAQQLVTDSVFESLMPRYCSLPKNTGVGCVGNRVQWNLVTYDAGGNPVISGSPTSGADYYYCPVVRGYVTAVIRGESATLPSLPPVGVPALGTDSVVMTVAESDPLDVGAAQRLVPDSIFDSLMRTYCALPRGSGHGYTSGRAQWNIGIYEAGGILKTSVCAASGCQFHSCVVSNGYITALIRSGCASLPAPPPPGQVAVGSDYVIMTVADSNPQDSTTAQQLVTDSIFESLMPQYCSLQGQSPLACVTNQVQWNVVTYDAGGNPGVSVCAASGCGFHFLGPRILSISAQPDFLWPPNGNFVPVTFQIQADDACGPSRFRVLEVLSSESAEVGKHNGANDWQITGDLSVNLRADRLEAGRGRTYNILIKCDDIFGNSTTASVSVLVPHDLGQIQGKVGR